MCIHHNRHSCITTTHTHHNIHACACTLTHAHTHKDVEIHKHTQHHHTERHRHTSTDRNTQGIRGEQQQTQGSISRPGAVSTRVEELSTLHGRDISRAQAHVCLCGRVHVHMCISQLPVVSKCMGDCFGWLALRY